MIYRTFNMSKQIYIYAILVLFCTSCLISGCKQNKEDTAYQGVGKLIAERHKARVAQSAGKREYTNNNKYAGDSTSVSNNQNVSQETISEKEVKIVSASSGRTIARGTAFLDETGKIINIKIDHD